MTRRFADLADFRLHPEIGGDLISVPDFGYSVLDLLSASGIAVAPGLVLTAAHVYTGPGGFYEGAHRFVDASYAKRSLFSIDASAWVPDFAVGVVCGSSPLSPCIRLPGLRLIQQAVVEGFAIIIGWGINDKTSTRERRAGLTTIRSIDDRQIVLEGLAWPCGGDSGGLVCVLDPDSDEPVAIGVLRVGDGYCDSGGTDPIQAISLVRPDLAEILGPRLGEAIQRKRKSIDAAGCSVGSLDLTPSFTS